MAEFIIYTDASVDSDGNTVVTPEVIAKLASDVLENPKAGDYTEGNFGLTVKYADLKTLIELAGHSVKEMTLTSAPEEEKVAEV